MQDQVTELEQKLKNEKSVPKKAQIRKQIAELQNGLTEQAQSTVSLNQPENTNLRIHLNLKIQMEKHQAQRNKRFVKPCSVMIPSKTVKKWSRLPPF
jgi:hypothetical protein